MLREAPEKCGKCGHDELVVNSKVIFDWKEASVSCKCNKCGFGAIAKTKDIRGETNLSTVLKIMENDIVSKWQEKNYLIQTPEEKAICYMFANTRTLRSNGICSVCSKGRNYDRICENVVSPPICRSESLFHKFKLPKDLIAPKD